MKVVVEDANILLDLVNGGILEIWLELGYAHYTTTLVWNEICRTDQKAKIQKFVDSGFLLVTDIEPEAWQELYDVSTACCIKETLI